MKKRRTFLKFGTIGFLGFFIKPYKAKAYFWLAPLVEFIGVNFLRMGARTLAKKVIQTTVRSGVRKATVRAITSHTTKKVALGSAITSFAVDLTADEIENQIFSLAENEIAKRLNYPKGSYEALWIIDENNILNQSRIKKQNTTIDYIVKNPNNKDIVQSLSFSVIDKKTGNTQLEQSSVIQLSPKQKMSLTTSFQSKDLKNIGIMQCIVQDDTGKTLKKSGLIIVEKMENLKKIV